jgi:tetratricopeptide (TPR) repeat protein
MSSELLSRLESQAASASTEAVALTYRAQWACAAARLGKIDQARSVIAALRSSNTAYSPELTAWIFLAEGMTHHFESLSSAALDRFKRAYGLAVAFGNVEIRSMAAAWIGASEFLLANYESAAKHALEAIQNASERVPLAKARAHLVLATCLDGAGALELASAHYTKARSFAVEARDISMQSVVLYNVAAFRVSRLSVDDAFGDSVAAELGVAQLEVSSIGNLDNGLGLGSLKAMVPLLRAQLHLIGRQWSEADALYDEFTAEATTQGLARHAPRYLAERAQCQAMLGRRADALRLVDDAVGQLVGRVDPDDRAACHCRLSLCLSSLGDLAGSQAHLEAARIHRAALRDFQDQLRRQTIELLSTGAGK